jgi:nucleotide-binding universal stress UspA family protein
VNRAVWLAQRNGSDIVLLCVRSHRDHSDADALENARLSVTLAAPEVCVRTITAIGSPALEILNMARREGVDIIVMGIDPKWHMESTWNADRAFQRFLLNSTVAKVIQDARCPVWLDKPSSAGTMKISNLVCFLDLKIDCGRLILFASRIAEECKTQMLLFHATVSTRIFAPGQPRNVVELQRYHVQMAESAIDQLQTRCSTSAEKIVAMGDGVAALCKTLKDFGSPLVVAERISDRWGDNHKIFEIIRYCKASILIRAEPKKDERSVPNPRKRIDPFVLLLASIGIGVALIYLIMHLAVQNDSCNFAAIRCQTPTDLLFGKSSEGKPAKPP